MEWLRLALSRSVVRRAARVAALVGALLVVINHGDALLRGDISLPRALQIVVTALIPYCVSTYSTVSALRGRVFVPEEAGPMGRDGALTLNGSARRS